MIVASEILDVVEAKIVEHKLNVPKARRRDPRWLLRNLAINNDGEAVDEVLGLCIAAKDSLEG